MNTRVTAPPTWNDTAQLPLLLYTIFADHSAANVRLQNRIPKFDVLLYPWLATWQHHIYIGVVSRGRRVHHKRAAPKRLFFFSPSEAPLFFSHKHHGAQAEDEVSQREGQQKRHPQRQCAEVYCKLNPNLNHMLRWYTCLFPLSRMGQVFTFTSFICFSLLFFIGHSIVFWFNFVFNKVTLNLIKFTIEYSYYIFPNSSITGEDHR